MDQTCPNWIKPVQVGSNLSKLDQICRIWIKPVQIGSKQADRQTDGWTDRPDEQTDQTDRRTDGRTDGRTDKASYRVACPQLKTVSFSISIIQKRKFDLTDFV